MEEMVRTKPGGRAFLGLSYLVQKLIYDESLERNQVYFHKNREKYSQGYLGLLIMSLFITSIPVSLR